MITITIIEINHILDTRDIANMSWAYDRIQWLAQTNKVSKKLTDALAVKYEKVMSFTWCGDEPEQLIIKPWMGRQYNEYS